MVDMVERYRKSDSIINFHGKYNSDRELVLSTIASLFTDNEFPLLSDYEKTILCQIHNDLFLDNNEKNKKFSISEYIIEEILSYKNKNTLPKYLFHRYRYEMFPLIYKVDDFQPYLPTLNMFLYLEMC